MLFGSLQLLQLKFSEEVAEMKSFKFVFVVLYFFSGFSFICILFVFKLWALKWSKRNQIIYRNIFVESNRLSSTTLSDVLLVEN